METTRLFASVFVMLVCGVILYLTLKSHWLLKKRRSDTVGKKAYRWLLAVFSLSGIFWPLSVLTFMLLFGAVLVERLIVYRGCYGRKTWLGKFLVKVNW